MRRIVAWALCLTLLLVTAAGCGGPADTGGTEGITFTDAAGRTVTAPSHPQCVAALSASFAQVWLLAGGTLAGVTQDAVEELQLPVGDAQIVGSVKTPDSERILALDPDFVILSADIAGHRDIARVLESGGIPHAFFKEESLSDYLQTLRIFTDLTGRDDLYAENGTAVAAQVSAVLDRVDPAVGGEIRVLFVRARSQGVSAKARDHMVCTILEEFGCVNIAAREESLLENLSLEQIIAQDPDVILVSVMGDEEAARAYLQAEWESNPAFSGLTAVREGRYFFLPKRLYHYKPNAAWGEAYETLYEMLFP